MAIAAILPTNILTFIFSPTKGLDNIKIIVEIPLLSYYLSYMYITLKNGIVRDKNMTVSGLQGITNYILAFIYITPSPLFLIVLRVLIMPILL